MIVQDYQEAAQWLSRGKRKWERPLYTRGLRLRRKPAINNPSPDIEVFCRWAQQGLVVYHSDGTTTIQADIANTAWGGRFFPLHSWSLRTTIRDFSGVRELYQRNNKIHIVFQDAAYKPGKLQKCRRCHGFGLVDGYCHLPYCYLDDCKDGIVDGYGKFHRHRCEHGLTTNHYTPKTDNCYSCQGNGKRLYGQGYVSMLWDGSPLRLQNGSLVNNKPSELEKAIAAYVPIS